MGHPPGVFSHRKSAQRPGGLWNRGRLRRRAWSHLPLLVELQRRQRHRHVGRGAGRPGTIGAGDEFERLGRSFCADALCVDRVDRRVVYPALYHVVHNPKLDAHGRHRRDGSAGDLQTQGEHSAPAQRNGEPDRFPAKGGRQVKVTVLGAGAWGTALAKILHQSGQAITLWGHDAQHLDELARAGKNERYLPGVSLPADWRFEPDLKRAAAGSECVVVAVPSEAFREVTRALGGYRGILVSVTKGIEYDTGLTMCGVLQENVPGATAVALSGPSLALEVARGVPSAVVAAGPDQATLQTVQQLFHRPTFRVYTGTDRLGVELGGALKNVIAIAAGAGDGLGFGDNSKAALLTRGIAEIRRLGVACGAQAETFAGLGGLGDLAVTCFSRLSRNRSLGERLGR